MTEINEKQKQFAIAIAAEAEPELNIALRKWLLKLLAITRSDASKLQKGRLALSVTVESKVILKTLKMIAWQSKASGWDNRTSTQKLGLGVAAVSIAIFGSAHAGIAALGGAVAVPLWVVFGAGSMFADYLYKELTRTSVMTQERDREFDLDITPNDN